MATLAAVDFGQLHRNPMFCGTAALGCVRLDELSCTAGGDCATGDYRFIHQSMTDETLAATGLPLRYYWCCPVCHPRADVGYPAR
jgi:hypothetical protein